MHAQAFLRYRKTLNRAGASVLLIQLRHLQGNAAVRGHIGFSFCHYGLECSGALGCRYLQRVQDDPLPVGKGGGCDPTPPTDGSLASADRAKILPSFPPLPVRLPGFQGPAFSCRAHRYTDGDAPKALNAGSRSRKGLRPNGGAGLRPVFV